MKTITKFVAKDGAEFLWENDAIEREKLIDDVENAMRHLSPMSTMKFDDIGQCWVADKDETFEGWRILAREQWKPGVERVHIRRLIPYAEFRIVYQNVRSVVESKPAANEWREWSEPQSVGCDLFNCLTRTQFRHHIKEIHIVF